MPTTPEPALTQLLRRVGDGDCVAESELLALIYPRLRKMAALQMQRERPGHTLQATALVHEVYLRLMKSPAHWSGRAHFFALAARAMRRVLVDYAGQHNAVKRGGGVLQLALDDNLYIDDNKLEQVLQVDNALAKLTKIDDRQAKIVEMRYFAGMTEDEIALVLGLSVRTIHREWQMAKAWLALALSPKAAGA